MRAEDKDTNTRTKPDMDEGQSKLAIEREKGALEREQLLVDREKKAPAGVVPEERRLSTVDYLKQGDQYIKDGQKYYKTGQGAMGGVNNFFR